MDSLTDKQRQVLDALDSTGGDVKASAKLLKVNTSNVYNHIRAIREKGYEVPRAENNGSTNGGVDFDVLGRVREAITQAQNDLASQQEQAEQFIRQQREIIDEAEREIAQAEHEQKVLDEQAKALSAAGDVLPA